MEIKQNWQSWLKVGGIILAVLLWAVSTQAKLDEHVIVSKDTIKLLMLICKNTAPDAVGKLDCYNTIYK